MGGGEERAEFMDVAGGVRILHEHAHSLDVRRVGRMVTDNDLEPERFGTGAYDVDGLRVTLFRNEKRAAFAAT